jgi:hypothetical protein
MLVKEHDREDDYEQSASRGEQGVVKIHLHQAEHACEDAEVEGQETEHIKCLRERVGPHDSKLRVHRHYHLGGRGGRGGRGRRGRKISEEGPLK